ncbi:WD40-repeat-containing domain protein [Hyaloraphidium curvatum]|nr:WD40-repeat-containing domain protein [Hyaloraphidium curvatum]
MQSIKRWLRRSNSAGGPPRASTPPAIVAGQPALGHRYNTRMRSRDPAAPLDYLVAATAAAAAPASPAGSAPMDIDPPAGPGSPLPPSPVAGPSSAGPVPVGSLQRQRRADSPTDSAFEFEDADYTMDFLTALPYELAIHVLTFLPTVQDVARASMVCRSWYAMTRDNEIWRVLFVERWVKPCPVAPALPSFPPLPLVDPSPIPRGLVASERSQPQDYSSLFRNRLALNRNWTDASFEQRKVEGHTDSVYCVQFDNDTIVSGSRDRTIKWWDMRSGRNFRTMRGHDGSVLCLQYSNQIAVPFFAPDDDGMRHSDGLVVSGSSDSSMMLWDFATGERISILRGHASPVLDVRFDERSIVSCSKDCTIKVWNLDTSEPEAVGTVRRTLEGHHAAVNAVYLYRNLVASASGDCTVKLWDLNTGGCIRDFVGHSRGLACVQFDGRLIVSGSNDKSVKVWDARTGTCARTLDGPQGHTELVRTLAFDNERIVSGSYDQAIKVWDLRAAGQETRPMLDLREAHSSWVFHVQMSPRRIVSASQDRKIMVWDFGRGIEDAWKFA